MDWQAHLEETARHIAWMASIPGARDHARWRMRELLEIPAYSQLTELVRKEIERNEQDDSAG